MLDRSQTIAKIVLDHSECAPIFQKHRMDFCCRGNVSLEEACTARGLDPRVVAAELEAAIAERRGDGNVDPRSLATPALVAHIVARHHEYLRKALPFVEGLVRKVARVHGDHEPKLRELERVVLALIEALPPHLAQEEEVLFPALTARDGDRGVIARELASMNADHLAVGSLLEQMRIAADDFTVPSWGCGSYRALFRELEALEGDVLRHVHLENHVLMPRFAPGVEA